MNASHLNKRVTLQSPTRASGTGPVRAVTGYATVSTVWAAVKPLTAGEAERAMGRAQTGSYRVTVRRPVYSGAAEVVPDRTWRATFTEAGEARTLEVSALMDATPEAPSPYFWHLLCTEVRR